MAAKKTAKETAGPAPKKTPVTAKPAAKKAAPLPEKSVAKKAPAKKAAAKKAVSRPSETKKPATTAKPSLDLIARAAYLNYRRRVENGLPGDSHGDWLEAERKFSS